MSDELMPFLWFQQVPDGRWHMAHMRRRTEGDLYVYEVRGDCARAATWSRRASHDHLDGAPLVPTNVQYVDPDNVCSFCLRSLDRRIGYFQQCRDDLLAPQPSTVTHREDRTT